MPVLFVGNGTLQQKRRFKFQEQRKVIMQVTTQMALEKIIEKFGGEWKRIRKCKPFKNNDGAEIRVFQNKKDPSRFASVFSRVHSCFTSQDIYWALADWVNWEKPQKGKFPYVIQEYCSGEIVYGIGDGDDGELAFYCGPEEGGHLNDSSEGWETDNLKYIFRDFDIEVGAAESYHIITLKNGQNYDDVAKEVKSRLWQAGAKEL